MVQSKTEIDEMNFQAFKSGSEVAFELIFKSYYDQIVGFCTQFSDDRDKGKSLAQEAFIKLWLNREKVEKISGIKSFLYTAAKTECLNDIRSGKTSRKYENIKLQEEEERLNREVLESFDFSAMEFIELEALINAAIEELPPKCREVFVKSRFEGKKNKEIAEEMGISQKAVEANMTRSLKFLKEKLSDYLPAVLVHTIISLF